MDLIAILVRQLCRFLTKIFILRIINLTHQQQLLCTQLFTTPSVLFPEFFLIAAITSIGSLSSINILLGLIFSYQSLFTRVRKDLQSKLITDTNNLVKQLTSRKWLKSLR